MLDNILKQTRDEMKKVKERFQVEIGKIRTSRANSSMVEDIQIEHYGTKMPLKQVASITTPQANLIQIMPWDKTILQPIETALGQVDLGASPVNDGNMIRISLPPMTGERREQLKSLLRKQAEETKVILRQTREEAWKKIQTQMKNSELTEDDKYRGKEELDKLVREFGDEIDKAVAVKEREISV